MDIEQLREICLALPGAEEDIKWGNDLCFCVGGKMFCVTGLNGPLMVSLKVGDAEFGELCDTSGIIPAPYLARYKWILVQDPDRFRPDEWRRYIRQSYEMIRSKLPAKVRKALE